MRIACLGWGSLIWDPRRLAISGEWFADGPLVPVEFARQSSDGRVTLVIESRARPQRVLWANLTLGDLSLAVKALCNREGISGENCSSRIGSWKRGDAPPGNIPDISAWAETRRLEAVVWTALGPRLGKIDRSPSCDEVIAYLSGLQGTVRERARQYVERAPSQIDTVYRRRIMAALGWSCSPGLQNGRHRGHEPISRVL
jgi:hypothetical protein